MSLSCLRQDSLIAPRENLEVGLAFLRFRAEHRTRYIHLGKASLASSAAEAMQQIGCPWEGT
jgi:hypothetical protein